MQEKKVLDPKNNAIRIMKADQDVQRVVLQTHSEPTSEHERNGIAG